MNLSSRGKFFIIPQDPVDREFLLAVDRRTVADVENKFGIFIDYDWGANTIANAVVETIIQHLSYILKTTNIGNGIGLNFYDIIRAIVSVKNNSKAEKEGNINIYFEPGDKIIHLIENGPEEYDGPKLSPIEFFKGSDPEETELYGNLEYKTRYTLSSFNGLSFTEASKFSVFAIGCTFITNIFVEMLYRLRNDTSDDDEKIVSVNFNDNIEIHGTLKDNAVLFNMRPGLNAKLLIKSDEMTENTMGLDDDEL